MGGLVMGNYKIECFMTLFALFGFGSKKGATSAVNAMTFC